MNTWVIPNAGGFENFRSLAQKENASVIIWRDTLYDGPVLCDLPSDVFLKLRASYLSTTYGLASRKIEQAGYRRDSMLGSALAESRGEIVIWSEPGMASQACIAQIFSRLRENSALGALSFAVCDNPLWKSNCYDLERCFTSRRAIAKDELAVIASIWEDYSSGRPLMLLRRLHQSQNLPSHFLVGFRRIFRELPDIAHTLDLTDLLLLRCASEEISASEIFTRLLSSDPLSQLEDLNFTHRLIRLMQMTEPAIASSYGDIPWGRWLDIPQEEKMKIMSSKIALTDRGWILLSGENRGRSVALFARWFGGSKCERHSSWCISDHLSEDGFTVTFETSPFLCSRY